MDVDSCRGMRGNVGKNMKEKGKREWMGKMKGGMKREGGRESSRGRSLLVLKSETGSEEP